MSGLSGRSAWTPGELQAETLLGKCTLMASRRSFDEQKGP